MNPNKTEKRGRGRENICFFLITAKNFSNLMKYINLQIQEDQQTSRSINNKRFTPRNIIIKLPKRKQQFKKFLKATKKYSCIQGTSTHLTAALAGERKYK